MRSSSPVTSYKIYQSLWQMIDFVYPPRCSGCDKPGELFCPDCVSRVTTVHQPFCSICGRVTEKQGLCKRCQKIQPSYLSARSWAEYVEPLRHALLSLKYKNNLGIARVFTNFLAEIVFSNNWQADIIIPIPLCDSHMKKRGFNQAEQLARPLSMLLGIPMDTRAVKRVKETSSQVDLSREERFKNLEDAFFGNPAKLKSKKVLLVDDIVTTGATLNSCTEAILAAGGSSVFCITVAQTTSKYHRTL